MIDIKKLRDHLINYYGLASYFNENAIADIIAAEQATDDELISMALECGFNLDDYEVKGFSL